MSWLTDTDRGRLILVGGHSRHVGKTTVIEALLDFLPAGEWSAVKVSSHRHGAPGSSYVISEETDPCANTQTGRFLRAGAVRAFLLRAPDATLTAAVTPLRTMLAAGANLIVESNRLAQYLEPDLVLFVISPSTQDWKASSGPCLRKAHGIVFDGEGGIPWQAVELAGERVLDVPRIRLDRLRARAWSIQRPSELVCDSLTLS